VRSAISDVSAKKVFTDEQRRVLRAAFEAIVEAFDGVLLLRGKRVTVEGIVVASGDTLDLSIDCPFKPKTVQVLDARGIVASGDGAGEERHLVYPTLTWSWSSTATGGTVRLGAPLSVLPDDFTYTFDIFMEKSDG